MKIGFGRKVLIVSVHAAAPDLRSKAFDIGYAIDASDHELARLNTTLNAVRNRTRWETSALQYGAYRLLEP